MASAPIINRVPPEFRFRLRTPLAADALSALRAMGANKLLRPVMSDETSSALIEAGYAKQTVGGVTLTDVGSVRAAMENGQ